MSYLFDTNILSELRKKQRQNKNVAAFTKSVGWNSIYTSWIVIAEMWRGVALVRRHDPIQAKSLDAFINETIKQLGERVLPVDRSVAEAGVALMVPNPRSPMDSLIAATALAHDLTLVTRNVRDYEGMGIDVFNPWEFTGD